MRKIVLISCCKSKTEKGKNEPIPAKELYIGLDSKSV